MIMFLPRRILEKKLRRLLEEDVGQGDITTFLTIPEGAIVEAEIFVKDAGVVAGIEEALIFLESFGFQTEARVADGEEVRLKTSLLKIIGDARTLLSLERTLLNLLSRMSGIATITNRIVKRVKEAGYDTRVACTRKVAPGLIYFDKKAVFVGGGDVHRFHQDDMVLIKDNHIVIVDDVVEAIRKVRGRLSFSKKIEVEVSSLRDAIKVAKANVDIIMLDNFSPRLIRKTLKELEKKKLRGKILVEASGGINEKNVLEFAAAGVDVLSLGEITQDARALDISLEVVNVRKAKRKR